MCGSVSNSRAEQGRRRSLRHQPRHATHSHTPHHLPNLRLAQVFRYLCLCHSLAPSLLDSTPSLLARISSRLPPFHASGPPITSAYDASASQSKASRRRPGDIRPIYGTVRQRPFLLAPSYLSLAVVAPGRNDAIHDQHPSTKWRRNGTSS